MTRLIAAFLLALLPSIATGHQSDTGQRYDAFCCNGNNHTGDCQMIPASSVQVIKGGYRVSIGPGSHRLATKPHTFDFPQDKARRSQDGEYHLCLFPDENTPRCLYVPDMSF